MNKPPEIELLSHKLKERIKELSCLYSISKIAQETDISITLIINKIINAIPEGWEYPEELNVCLEVDNILYGSKIIDTNILSTQIIIQNVNRGNLSVGYRTQRDFLAEEQLLLNQIGVELSLIIDRNEQMEIKKLYQQKMLQEDKINVLGELTAGIAHELNTPLGNILGYAELLNKSEKDIHRKSDLNRIISSALRSREIVKKLMYFSCEMPTQYSLHDINSIISESIDLLKLQLSENNVILKLDFDSHIPSVKLDSIQMTQVLFNLVLNSIGAMPKGGEITIKTWCNESAIFFSLNDTGTGISNETISKIFQPFYTTKHNGTGLGLSVVHGIIQSHRGTIEVSSKVNQGTRFQISLPILAT